MTQEFIGNMLGVRREGVTQSASKLQQLGVISYSRGRITVPDRPQQRLHSDGDTADFGHGAGPRSGGPEP